MCGARSTSRPALGPHPSHALSPRHAVTIAMCYCATAVPAGAGLTLQCSVELGVGCCSPPRPSPLALLWPFLLVQGKRLTALCQERENRNTPGLLSQPPHLLSWLVGDRPVTVPPITVVVISVKYPQYKHTHTHSLSVLCVSPARRVSNGTPGTIGWGQSRAPVPRLSLLPLSEPPFPSPVKQVEFPCTSPVRPVFVCMPHSVGT